MNTSMGVLGDEDAAYRAMTSHISSGGNVYADAIASMPHGSARTPQTPLRVAQASEKRAPAVAGRKRAKGSISR